MLIISKAKDVWLVSAVWSWRHRGIGWFRRVVLSQTITGFTLPAKKAAWSLKSRWECLSSLNTLYIETKSNSMSLSSGISYSYLTSNRRNEWTKINQSSSVKQKLPAVSQFRGVNPSLSGFVVRTIFLFKARGSFVFSRLLHWVWKGSWGQDCESKPARKT